MLFESEGCVFCASLSCGECVCDVVVVVVIPVLLIVM